MSRSFGVIFVPRRKMWVDSAHAASTKRCARMIVTECGMISGRGNRNAAMSISSQHPLSENKRANPVVNKHA